MKRTKRKRNDYDELRGLLRIDISNIDDELVEHPVIFERIASMVAAKISERDSVKEYLKHIAGRIEARACATIDGRATRDAITNAVEEDEEWQEERAKYLEACAEVERWIALKESWQSRGYALHNLSALVIARMKSDSSYAE